MHSSVKYSVSVSCVTNVGQDQTATTTTTMLQKYGVRLRREGSRST